MQYPQYPIVSLNLCKLYHTTGYHNKKNIDCGGYIEEYKIPFGEYSTDMKSPKWFTVSPFANYASKYGDFAYLEYYPKRTLRLVDLRSTPRMKHEDTFDLVRKYNVDGYLGVEDFIEVLLLEPDKVVYPMFKHLEHCVDCGKSSMEMFKSMGKAEDDYIVRCTVTTGEVKEFETSNISPPSPSTMACPTTPIQCTMDLIKY
jgi:hypothetical protein